jgi:diguanylate cyclase (GGDEF)-like protein/PAS domain S-box-containing protein
VPARSRTAAVTAPSEPAGPPRVAQDADGRESWLLRHLPAAVVLVDEHGTVVYWNDEASALFGRALDDVLGASVRGLGIWPHALAHWKPEPGIPGEALRIEEHRATRPDGSTVTVRTRAVRLDDPQTGFRGLLGMSVATEDRRRGSGRTARLPLAQSDPATGLPNLQVFIDHLGRTMTRNTDLGRLTAVFSVGVQHRRGTSGTEVHDLPRSALRALAKRISRVLREHDLVAYLGEGEFAVCCDVWDREDALVVARRILRAALSASSNPALRRASATIGAAVADGGSRPEALLAEAQTARRGATEPDPGALGSFPPTRHDEDEQAPQVFALRAERRARSDNDPGDG